MFRTLSIGVLAFLAAACGSSEADKAGPAEDDIVGRLTWSNEPFHWVDIDRATFEDSATSTSVSATDPTAIRIQAWVDRYDDIVRTIVLEQSGKPLVAPKPAVRLIAGRDVGARVAFTPACLLDATAGAAPLPSRVLMSDPHTQRPTSECVVPKGWPDATASIDWFNGLGGLQLRPEGGRIKILGGATELEADVIAVRSAAPYVDVFAGLVASVDEKVAAITLAHEASHYYRAHGATAIKGQYGFWFERDRPTAERPVPAPNQADYPRLFANTKVPRLTIEGQKTHARVAESVLAWGAALKVAPGHACEPVQKIAEAWSPAVRESFFGKGGETDTPPISAEAKSAYLGLESALLACAPSVVLSDAPEVAGAIFDGASAPRAFFLDRLTDPFRGLAAADLPASTLADLLAVLTSKARAIDVESAAFSKRLEQNRIGLYTIEQEADDLAMDLAARVGITPDDVIGGFLQFFGAIEAALDPQDVPSALRENNGMTTAQCAALAKRGFQDGDKEVYVPLGAVYNLHHADCYRIFNLYRQKAVHGYPTAAPSFPEATVPWTELQDHARALIGGNK